MIVYVYSRIINDNTEEILGIKIKNKSCENLELVILSPNNKTHIQAKDTESQLKDIRDILENIHHYHKLSFIDCGYDSMKCINFIDCSVNPLGNYLLSIARELQSKIDKCKL